jgi:hypothetical protein
MKNVKQVEPQPGKKKGNNELREEQGYESHSSTLSFQENLHRK